VDQAELQQTISGNGVLDSVLDVSLQIRLHYIEALRAQAAVEIDERIVVRLENLAQTAPSSIAPFLQIELSNARQDLSQSRTDADLALESLRNSLRLPADTPLLLTTELNQRRPVFEREGLLATALANRPDVRQSELRIEQAQLGVLQTDDYRRPSLRVSAYYNAGLYGEYFFEPGDGRTESGGLTLGLNVPLGQWDNGNLRRQRERAEIDVEQAQADAVEHRESVAQELRQVLISLDRAEQRLIEMSDESDAYQGMVNAERDLLAASGDEASSLLAQTSNARQAWSSAQLSAVSARIDYYRAAFRLIRALGLEPGPGSYSSAPGQLREAGANARNPRNASAATVVAASVPVGDQFPEPRGAEKGLISRAGATPERGDDMLVLHRVSFDDAPPAELTRAATQTSEIAPATNHDPAPRSNRGTALSRFARFLFGARPRTVIWE
jgi:outer membrane protein TolC